MKIIHWAMITLGLAEDVESHRNGIIDLLQRNYFQVIISAKNGFELLQFLKNGAFPDLILLDLWMPEMDGLQTATNLLRLYPNTKIIALTGMSDPSHVISMYKIGVKSFVWKIQFGEIIKAVKVVSKGGYYFPDDVGAILRDTLTEFPGSRVTRILNDSELQLARWICKGLSSREIGYLLNKSPRTIEDYRFRLYDKFGVSTKEEFVVKVVQYGIKLEFSDGNN